MPVAVSGEKVFHAKIGKNAKIGSEFKGYEEREVYVVIIPLERETVLEEGLKKLMEE